MSLSVTQFALERAIRQLEVRSVLDVGCRDSEYIPFLFTYVGRVYGIESRFINETHPNIGFFSEIFRQNIRYIPDGFLEYDYVTCTGYLARCGILYSCAPDTQFIEQRKILAKILGIARKGIFVTVPYSSTPEERRVVDGQFIYDKHSLPVLLEVIENPGYNVSIHYYKDNDIISPQEANGLQYPDYAMCAIEVIKRRN